MIGITGSDADDEDVTRRFAHVCRSCQGPGMSGLSGPDPQDAPEAGWTY